MTTVNIDLGRLNAQQRKAVETTEGRVLILAGAGSGKTSVLTTRMAYLIASKGVDPQSLLGLTFTNKAAQEMRERMAQMVGNELAGRVFLSTFHSFCMSVLRKHIHRLGYTKAFTLYDEGDIHRLLSGIARDILRHESELPSISGIYYAIQKARSQGICPDAMDSSCALTKKCYQRLFPTLRAFNAVDFDSLLDLTVRLFETKPQVLTAYQERFRYLMIDEYQDTNPVQYRLAKLLASKYNNFCVVGDDDQSIYGWRGADVQNILNFSDATVIRLEQNYRSTNTILSAANTVIGNNAARHHKQLWSQKGDGEPIELFVAPDEKTEAEAVVCRMDALRKKRSLKWRDMAILYRSNALSRQFEKQLLSTSWFDGSRMQKGIPYQVFGGTAFYERREVKDLMSYLKAVANPKDQASILRIINQPRRGISDKTVETVTEYQRSRGKDLWELLKEIRDGLDLGLTKKGQDGISLFVATLEEAGRRFEQESYPAALDWLIEAIEYKKVIDEEAKSDKQRIFKWDNVKELVSALAETKGNLTDFLAGIALQDEFKKQKGQDADAVTLMTFHSAKGLEFPAVFLVGLEDHIIPHERSLMESGIEEERRLMYVAITRAKYLLTCSLAQKRMRMGHMQSSKPSRFIFEIPGGLLRKTRWGDA